MSARSPGHLRPGGSQRGFLIVGDTRPRRRELRAVIEWRLVASTPNVSTAPTSAPAAVYPTGDPFPVGLHRSRPAGVRTVHSQLRSSAEFALPTPTAASPRTLHDENPLQEPKHFHPQNSLFPSKTAHLKNGGSRGSRATGGSWPECTAISRLWVNLEASTSSRYWRSVTSTNPKP